ncbi:zn 2cys6 transcription factor [Diplodia corticola]|uniref:Zn 2cys6 transcription factor n=1 Tax=Diplodia corticola TaxID=236234 RepID=A0A1J9RQ07_9PEZI|nr:zn 2cys6 transcription factor [Diplodia corticola]OJD29996.1 zn 2cys6 transcription factor [Diplodia corticola]
MRTSRGCHECKRRHLKCITQPGCNTCERCEKSGRECRRGITIRFRAVTSVREKRAPAADDDADRNYELSWKKSQVWVRVPPAVTFATPATTLEDLDEDQAVTYPARLGFSPEEPPASELPDASVFRDLPTTTTPITTTTTIAAIPAATDHSPAPPLDAVNIGSPYSPFGNRSDVPPSSATPGGGDASTVGSGASYWKSSLYQPSTEWPLRSEDEARLFHHFVKHLGAWVDCCDEKFHFSTEVPLRALNYPVIANAILALASRHLARVSGVEDFRSAEYMSECLRILIPVLDDPLGALDENLLAAIVILRLYEEMDDIDEKCHLYGGTRLLNSIAKFVPLGGLGEAASWIFLRQDIYVALTTGQPLNIDLENYRQSPSFHADTSSAWANRMIFIFAEILDYSCRQDQVHSVERWEELDEQVESWNHSKPWHFRPLWIREETLPFPEIWMTGPAHVVGQQYYSLSKILLGTFDPRLSRLGFGSHKLRKNADATIVKHLRTVIGLAISNEGVPAATFHASHILCACGSYLEDEADREGAVQFLLELEKKVGWRSSRIVATLRESWET